MDSRLSKAKFFIRSMDSPVVVDTKDPYVLKSIQSLYDCKWWSERRDKKNGKKRNFRRRGTR